MDGVIFPPLQKLPHETRSLVRVRIRSESLQLGGRRQETDEVEIHPTGENAIGDRMRKVGADRFQMGLQQKINGI